MDRYLKFWDAILRPLGRYALRNRNMAFGVQIMRWPKTVTKADQETGR